MSTLTKINQKTIVHITIAIITLGLFLVLRTDTRQVQDKNTMQVESYITERMVYCHTHNDTSECYKTNAVDFLNQFKLSDIVGVFLKKENSPEFFNKCHTTAHFLGQEAYKKYGSISAVFSEANHACLGGVYHGAIEGYFMSQGIIDTQSNKVRQEISRICGTAQDYNDPQKFIECDHGLGHATMYLTENDLPKALDLCDALTSKSERDLCYTGALMANADSFGSTEHPTKYVRPNDPLYPCSILKKSQQEMCYTYGALTRSQSNLPKSISICLRVPDEFKHPCFETIGRDRTIISSDLNELKSECYQIKEDEFRRDCISGTAYNLVIRFGATSTIGVDYCGIIEAKYKNNCYIRIFGALGHITRDKNVNLNFCQKVTDSTYKNQCLGTI